MSTNSRRPIESSVVARGQRVSSNSMTLVGLAQRLMTQLAVSSSLTGPNGPGTADFRSNRVDLALRHLVDSSSTSSGHDGDAAGGEARACLTRGLRPYASQLVI